LTYHSTPADRVYCRWKKRRAKSTRKTGRKKQIERRERRRKRERESSTEKQKV
jgi:hypothetical protein